MRLISQLSGWKLLKAALTTSENQLRLANNKLEDVSVKKLTRQNPIMKSKFDSL